jgi:predicted ATPase
MTVICRCLDGLPLALELAAPWIKALTLDDLRRRLEHDSLLGTIGARDLPERQQTMNATVAWSYRLLDPEEQCAFRRFGVLPGLFPIDAAEAVLAGREGVSDAGAALRVVGGLIDKSLLVRSDSPVVATCPLYRMLDTVRAYAALELTAAGERDDAVEGLARYCAGEVSLAAEGLVGPAQVEWLDRVREDLASYRVVLTWLVERGRLTEACHIAWGLLWFWVIRGHAIEGLRWYEFWSAAATAGRQGCSMARQSCSMRGDFDRARNVSRALILAGFRRRRCRSARRWITGFVEHVVGNLDAARLPCEV